MAFVPDPSKLWTIEAPNRRLEDEIKTKKQNEDVCRTLDHQLQDLKQSREQSRETDIRVGKQMIEKDLAKTTMEEQVKAFKRHEMTKQLREAWGQQKQFKDNEKAVEKIF